MNCPEARPHIWALVDGELDATTAKAVDRHVAACASCAAIRAEAESLHGSLSDILRSSPAPERDALLRDRVLADLAPWSFERRESPLARVAGALAALALIAVFIGLGPRRGAPGDPSPWIEIPGSAIVVEVPKGRARAGRAIPAGSLVSVGPGNVAELVAPGIRLRLGPHARVRVTGSQTLGVDSGPLRLQNDTARVVEVDAAPGRIRLGRGALRIPGPSEAPGFTVIEGVARLETGFPTDAPILLAAGETMAAMKSGLEVAPADVLLLPPWEEPHESPSARKAADAALAATEHIANLGRKLEAGDAPAPEVLEGLVADIGRPAAHAAAVWLRDAGGPPTLRRALAARLVALADPSLLPALLPLAGDGDAEVVQSALGAISQASSGAIRVDDLRPSPSLPDGRERLRQVALRFAAWKAALSPGP